LEEFVVRGRSLSLPKNVFKNIRITAMAGTSSDVEPAAEDAAEQRRLQLLRERALQREQEEREKDELARKLLEEEQREVRSAYTQLQQCRFSI
jgi:hypothetical protein